LSQAETDRETIARKTARPVMGRHDSSRQENF
jgi:hypothetical protein